MATDRSAVAGGFAPAAASPDARTATEGLDLVLTRRIDAPRALVWRAWTEPELLRQWWAPAPVETPECTLDPRPGGSLRALMRMPDGTEHRTDGVFLELVAPERIVFTDALVAGWRPAASPFLTLVVTLAHDGGGTAYTVRALHRDVAGREEHERRGFHEFAGKCVDQLAALVKQIQV